MFLSPSSVPTDTDVPRQPECLLGLRGHYLGAWVSLGERGPNRFDCPVASFLTRDGNRSFTLLPLPHGSSEGHSRDSADGSESLWTDGWTYFWLTNQYRYVNLLCRR